MKINLKKSLLLFFVLLSIQSHSKIIYVNVSVINGNNNGTSWQDSYVDFQDAISEAVYGDSILVAQGTYFPTSDTNQDISFELKNGVKWFGGFQGNETELGQRDFELYPTMLSGEIGIQGDSLDNSYHVVYTISSDTTTILDGFFIVEGRAIDPIMPNGSPRNFGGGLLIDAMENDSIAEPKILNCTFENNKARYGGGICLGKGSINSHIAPYIFNCNFQNNEALVQDGGRGGAISLIGGNSNLSDILIIEDCLFQDNSATYFGGAVYLSEVGNTTKFINCNFLNNKTIGGNPNVESYGGAISYDILFYNNLPNLVFQECFFQHNSAKIGGALSVRVLNVGAEGVLGVSLENSYFLNNILSSGGVLLRGSAIDIETRNNKVNVNIVKSEFFENSDNEFHPVLQLTFSPFTNPLIDNLNFILSDCKFVNNKSLCLSFTEIGFNASQHFYKISNTLFAGNKRVINFGKQEESQLSSKILNCTFFNNKISTLSGYNLDFNSDIEVGNSIFWEDLNPDEIFSGEIEGYNIHHSLLKSPDCLINGIDYCGDGMLYNLYPEFRDTMNNDFSLRSCSPAINQGDNLSIDTLGIFFDIEGNPRILDNAVDLGAYETQAFEVLVPQSQNVKCNGGADGAITWVQHGTPPFTFEWDNGVTTGTEFTGLSAGNYSIAVMDADNCLDTFTMTVNQPLLLEIMDTITAATGATNADGMIEVIPSGGFPDYQYLWSNGDTTALIENILPGIYTVTVTDANGCVEIVELEVGFMTAINNVDKKYAVQLIPNLMEQGMAAHLVFDLEKNGNFEIEIFNEIGQQFFSKKIEIGAGRNKYELPNLKQRGLFFVRIKKEKGGGQILKWIVL